MKMAFEIYMGAIVFYALITFWTLFIPIMYVMSLAYVLTFGWFAWLLFTLIYVIADNLLRSYPAKLFVLFLAVIPSVAFAFNIIGMLEEKGSIWHSGFTVFPCMAVAAGWISLIVSSPKLKTISDSAGKIKRPSIF